MNMRLTFARLFSAAIALLMGMLLSGSLVPAAAAHEPAQQQGTQQGAERHNPEKLRALIQARLQLLSDKLALKDAQQPAWNAFAKSVEALAERNFTPPGENADAASIARFRADLAAGFAKKLSAIADTTAKLQTVLNDGQRKIFNEEYRRLRHHGGARCEHHGMSKNRDDGIGEDGDEQP